MTALVKIQDIIKSGGFCRNFRRDISDDSLGEKIKYAHKITTIVVRKHAIKGNKVGGAKEERQRENWVKIGPLSPSPKPLLN